MLIPTVDAVRKSLMKSVPHLELAHDRAIRGLVEDGLASDDGNGGAVAVHAAAAAAESFAAVRKNFQMTQLQAAQDQRNLALLRNIEGQARHLDVADLLSDKTKPIDVHQLDKRLAGKNIEDRFRFKEALHFLKLIPA
jgi:hypothetical protein